MGKRAGAWHMLLVFFVASVVVAAAQSTKGISSNDSCANVDCMQGTCIPNDDSLISIFFPYKCKCNSGWSTLQQLVPILKVPSLPCNVPNCTLNLECAGKSPAPAPVPGSNAPISSANTTACLVPGICGHGTCEITSSKASLVPTFKCVCDPGYANVLNMTAGFCVNHCEINGGCQNLNLTLPGLNPPPPPPSTPTTPEDQTSNAGTSPEPSPSGTPESVVSGEDSSPSTSAAGRRGKAFNGGLYMAAALVSGWSFFHTLLM